MFVRCNLLLATAGIVLAGCPFKHDSEAQSPAELAACPGATQPQKTVHNCTCSSPCSATKAQEKYKCDVCDVVKVPNTLCTDYDYCAYPVDPDYEARSWKTKLDTLWDAVDANHNSGSYPSVLKILHESVQTSFDNHADTMPAGRLKYIHSMGAVCKFHLDVKAGPFTGLLESGTTASGLIRMGSALPVTTSSGVVPGVGVKFLRSNVPSANFVALNSLNPLPNNSYNFFERPLFNHIAAPDSGPTIIVANKFLEASVCPTMVGLSDICQYDINGKRNLQPIFPYKLVLEPGAVHFPSAPMTQDALQELLSTIKRGTELYKVTAYLTPTKPIVIGSIIADSDCVNSHFGDTSLFFKHQQIEDDWKLSPSFMAAVNAKTDCGVDSISTDPPARCA